MKSMNSKTLAGALALGCGVGLAGCAGGMPDNRSLYSVNQPVVERANYALDLATDPGGLPVAEQQRLTGWFEAMDLRYGDRVALDDPTASPAVREAVEQLAGRYGVLLADGAPVTAGYVQPGQARIVLTRSTASVPNCPNWSVKSEANYSNAISPNYGCAVNGNLAAMVANPEDLIKGQAGTGETIVTTSTKAIETYRSQAPTGANGLPAVASGGGGGGQ